MPVKKVWPVSDDPDTQARIDRMRRRAENAVVRRRAWRARKRAERAVIRPLPMYEVPVEVQEDLYDFWKSG